MGCVEQHDAMAQPWDVCSSRWMLLVWAGAVMSDVYMCLDVSCCVCVGCSVGAL